jgi:alpha-tubulin suppressor-like RCC1 family protein
MIGQVLLLCSKGTRVKVLVLDRRSRGALLFGALWLAVGCSKTASVPFAPRSGPDSGQSQSDDDGGSGSGNFRTGVSATMEEMVAQLQGWGADLHDPDKLCAAQDFSCALDKHGGAHCWGQKPDPPADLPALTQIACGTQHVCGLAEDATLRCWGAGSDPTVKGIVHQGQAIPPIGKFKQVAAGGLHSCAIDVSDKVVCWGAGAKDKKNGEQPNYGQALAPGGAFTSIACGQAHSCAVELQTGAVKCWGGIGSGAGCFPPDDYDCGQRDAPPGKFVEVTAGDMHSCALRDDGTVACWGRGVSADNCAPDSGGTAFDCGQSSPPTKTMAPFARVRAGWEYTCGITEDYDLLCWGWNSFGMTKPPMGKYSQVAGGGDQHGCAIRTTGEIVCWGSDAGGKATVPPGVPGK